jgi:hypothetical protein
MGNIDWNAQKVARGIFINTAEENCSIHGGGRMVFNCLKDSRHYSIDYLSPDMFDVPLSSAFLRGQTGEPIDIRMMMTFKLRAIKIFSYGGMINQHASRAASYEFRLSSD